MTATDSRVRFASESDSAVAASTALARSALVHWQWAVRGISFTARSGDACTALRRLTAWYERMCVDDTYDHPAPPDGLDALTALERGEDIDPSQRVLVTHWAVRVALELARWRRGLTHDGDAATAFLEHAKLDLALQGAFDRLR